MTNWNLAKMQYEAYGKSLEDIADDFEVSLKMVEYAAETQGWQDNAIDSDLAELKEMALGPKRLMLEATLLDRCMEILNGLDTSSVTAPDICKVISDVLKTLKPQDSNKSAEAGGLKVLIMNKVGQEAENAVDVKIN